ncbi:RNA recognition motif-containing protein [Cryptosporidium ubiquitum]|uniref:RNA recognition motif-containing protein n=1 Tax=Cryptosporidium ubiquitum TaxID=857276 RepID=A0A1J4MEU6_9CRYT|nr:RNA recognition motif-containing protein [Cryptosporidium ubiquitum]OII71381.1 RNA recognition motif-containing protein [Cryptosporidium ubiquitum]
METVSEELIKLLPREDLENLIRKLNLEVSELKDEVKFWRCRAEESSKEQGKVLIRSSISEEMLNELNNLAGKMNVLKIMDEEVNKENKEESDLINKKAPIQKSLSPISHPNQIVPSSASGNNVDSNSFPVTESVSRAAASAKLKSMFLKKAPPKMMSRADFVKKSEQKNCVGAARGNITSEVSAQSQLSSSIKKGSSRISLQWGCLAEEYPKFDSNMEESLFKNYFSEFENKLSVLINEEDSREEPKLELFSNSVFSKDSQTEDLQIPCEKLFEWFIKKESIQTKKTMAINNLSPSNTGHLVIEEGKQIDRETGKSKNKDKSPTNKINQKNMESTGKEVRACLFGSKTSRMLQITINYFKKKLPKDQQKSLDFFKKSILNCTLDKEGVNLLLETVPDPLENAAKYEIWKECVRSVERYLESNSRETLFEEEEFVYFLSRIPNLSKRLECMILRSSFEQLYCESLKWIEEKIRGLELIINHKRLPLLFKAIIDSRNILNSKLGKENQNEVDKVKFIPLSSMKKLQNLKSPNIQGKTLLNFISSLVGKIFTKEEISILKKSSEKNITMVYTMVTDLIFSWLELRDKPENLVFATETHSNKEEDVMEYNDEFQNIMKQFYSEKYSQMITLCNTFRKMLRLYVASCYYFGDISTFLPLRVKLDQGKQDLVETLFEFINKYDLALKQEIVKDNEQTSPKSVENTPRDNPKKPLSTSTARARRLSHINDMKNILNPNSSSKPKEFSNQSLSSMAKPKINIQQLFAKSIVKELNLKPLFNKDSENKSERHVSFSDGKIGTLNNNNSIASSDINSISDTSIITGVTDKTENNNFTNGILSKSVTKDETRSSVQIEDIEKTIALPLASFCENNQVHNKNLDTETSYQNGIVKRSSILELSKEAKEILSRDKTNKFSLNLSSSFDDDVSLDDELDDDNETIALSSPSHTRLLDISSMLDSNTTESAESSNSISVKFEKDGIRKKVLIMTEENYESPVRDNTKFNRRQSIRRMCQIATYLDNSGYNDEIEENDDLNNGLSRYKSPMLMVSRNTTHSSNISSSPSSERTRNSQEELNDQDYEPDFDNDNSKTCILNEILEVSNPLDELEQSNSKSENINIHNPNYYNHLQNVNSESKVPPEYSPQKITFTRKSGRFGGTLSPPYN